MQLSLLLNLTTLANIPYPFAIDHIRFNFYGELMLKSLQWRRHQN
jgi:hypothetical protein